MQLWLLAWVLLLCGLALAPSSNAAASLPPVRRLKMRGREVAKTSELVGIVANATSPLEKPPSHHSSIQTVNLLMLSFYATLGSVMPYLPVFYKRLGVSDSQLGLLGAITPAVTFLVSPLWGALADSTGRHRQIMLLTFLGSVAARTAMVACKEHIAWLSLAVAVAAILYAPVKPLLDSAVMALISDKSDFGRSRLYGQLGFGLGSFLVGPLLASRLNYIFAAQALLAIPTAALMWRFHPPPPATAPPAEPPSLGRHRYKTINVLAGVLDLMRSKLRLGAGAVQQKKQEEEVPVHVCKAVTQLLRAPPVAVFFAIIFVLGISSGIVENFAYVRLAQVATTRSGDPSSAHVLGVSRLASSLAGGPMFWLSGRVNKALGIHGVLALSLLFYVARFAIYANITNPWHAMPAELLRGVTFAMLWSGATYYVYSVSPRALSATMLGLLNAVYGGLGQSLGALLGGEMCRTMGIVRTFRSMALLDTAVLICYVGYELAQQYASRTGSHSKSTLCT